MPEDHIAKYRVASVVSAFDLLSAFLGPRGQSQELGVSELARRCGQTKNQTFRLLQTLVGEGVVIQNPETRTYSLGYRLVELGNAAGQRSSLTQAASTILDRLAAETGETVNLGALTDDFAAVCLDKRESRWALQISAKVGARLVLHAGAIPKLLLAFSPPDFFDRYLKVASPLKQFTPFTCIEPGRLREECARITAEGFAISDEDLDLGACSVAAPIRNNRGEVVGGVSVASPKSRFGREEEVRNRTKVLAASHEISRRLGYVAG